MKAVIVTFDKMSLDILKRCLTDRSFDPDKIETYEPAYVPLRGKEFENCIIFVDLDAKESYDVMLNFPPEARVVVFGSSETKKRAKGSLEARFIMKPFSQDRVESVLAKALISDISIKAPIVNPMADVGNLNQEWREVTEKIEQERQRISAILKSTPEQLKAMLSAESSQDVSEFSERLPIRTALIVEKDNTVSQAIAKLLSKKCVLSADICEDGKQAWKSLKTNIYDLVILSWEIEQLSGLAIYNRMRMTAKYRYVPILVISNQVQKKDFRLLDEDFATALVEKPLQERILNESLDQIVTAGNISKKFLDPLMPLVWRAVESGAFARYEIGLKGDEIILQALKLAGDQFIDRSQIFEAESSFSTAWNLGDRRLSLVTGYAKACHLSGKHQLARELLLTADVLAPKNVERLCLLGELDLTLHNPEEAQERFSQVLQIDPGMVKAKAGQHVAETIIEQGAEGMGSHPIDQFSAYLNMVGIGLSRGGKIQTALAYYKSAISFVREKEKRAKVWFNMGICHLRGHQPTEARTAFRMALKLSDGALTKAAKYLEESEAPSEADILPSQSQDSEPAKESEGGHEDVFERI